MPEGTVKWFSEKRGYGFIVQEDGSEIFVHYSGINKLEFKSLQEGDRVTYDIGEGKKGPIAVNVAVIK